MKIGFAVSEVDVAVEGYLSLYPHAKLIDKDLGWRSFYNWVSSEEITRLDILVVTSMWPVPYLDIIRCRIPETKIVGLELGEPIAWSFDEKYTARDLGWGVDVSHWKEVGENRIWQHQPVFYMTEPDPVVEAEIAMFGHKVVRGRKTYSMGNVAVVPSSRVVPHDIYEALASGMPVVTVEGNRHWLDGYPSFQAVLEDGVDAVVGEVASTDFRFMGMMAQEIVPDKKEWRDHVASILSV